MPNQTSTENVSLLFFFTEINYEHIWKLLHSGLYAACIVNFHRRFGTTSQSEFGVSNPSFLIQFQGTRPYTFGLTGFPETSLRIYHYAPHNKGAQFPTTSRSVIKLKWIKINDKILMGVKAVPKWAFLLLCHKYTAVLFWRSWEEEMITFQPSSRSKRKNRELILFYMCKVH